MATARKKHSIARRPMRHRIQASSIKRMYKNSLNVVKGNPYKSSLVTLGVSLVSGMLIWYRLFRK